MWLRRFLGGDLCTHLPGISKSPRTLVPALVTPDWIVYTYQPGDYDSVTIDKLQNSLLEVSYLKQYTSIHFSILDHKLR